MNHESFVYKWINKENGMYYIGKHKGTDNDGYISSGKAFLEEYNYDPESFYREIVYRGTDRECLNMEQNLIKQSVRLDGYQKLYNQTGWALLKEWKRTCTHCGNIVDPRNEEWLKSFSERHFENCPTQYKEKKVDYTFIGLNNEIGRLMKLNTEESGYVYASQIRALRKRKNKLLGII